MQEGEKGRLPAFCHPVATHGSPWDPATAQLSVPLNVQVDGRIVPSLSSPDGARVDFSRVVVLDGLFNEHERAGLWEALIGSSQITAAKDASRHCPSDTAMRIGLSGDDHRPERQCKRPRYDEQSSRTSAGPYVMGEQSQQQQQQQQSSEGLPVADPVISSNHWSNNPSPSEAFPPGARQNASQSGLDRATTDGMAQSLATKDGLRPSCPPRPPGDGLERTAVQQKKRQSHLNHAASNDTAEPLGSENHSLPTRPQQPPSDRWERRTADIAGLPGTWGLMPPMLDVLASGQLPAVLEVQTRLCRLYPEYIIAHMPTDAIESPPSDAESPCKPHCEAAHSPSRHSSSTHDSGMTTTVSEMPSRQVSDGRCNGDLTADVASALGEAAEEADAHAEKPHMQGHCSSFLGNAAVHGDTFQWHVDADPSDFPQPSPWTDVYGQYCNREPGLPMFVSLLLYLDPDWSRDYAAETLFLDADSDVGFAVRPRPYRAILMDQDVLHRVSAPSVLANGRPRYSLVWKLVFFPKHHCTQGSIARSEWGSPANIGSAAKVQQVLKAIAGKSYRA